MFSKVTHTFKIPQDRPIHVASSRSSKDNRYCNAISNTLPEQGSFCQGKGSRGLHRVRSKDSAEELQQLPNQEG